VSRHVLVRVALTVVLLAALLPILYLVSLSVRPPDDVLNSSLWPREWTTANFTSVFHTIELGTMLQNSWISAVGAALLAVAIATPAAYFTARRVAGERLLTALLAAVVDHDRAGVQFQDDWDALGQRLSASGSVRFDNVAIAADDVLGVVGEEPYSTLVTPGVQLGFANLYLGIAEGALARARELTLARRGAWLLSSVEHYSRDPFVQRVFGELLARAAAAEALTDRWNTEYDRVIARGAEVTAEDRARVEIGIAKAKIVTTETALEVAHRVFEVTGSSSARSEVGLDLFWRNIRTHSLHDPVDYKKLEVGANYLTGDVQPITLYT